jgi:transketolase
MLPGMTVKPCDYNQTKAATLALADHHGPAYLRFGRPVVPNLCLQMSLRNRSNYVK